MKEHIDGGAKVAFGVRRKSECVCGEESCVQNECGVQSCEFQQEVIHDQTHTNNSAELTSHTVFVVVVQAVLTPAVHVAAAAHVVHGVLPEVEKDVPATHGTLHAVSVFVVQAVLTPAVHVAAAAQALHGVLPEVEKDVPASHGGWHSAAQSVS